MLLGASLIGLVTRFGHARTGAQNSLHMILLITFPGERIQCNPSFLINLG